VSAGLPASIVVAGHPFRLELVDDPNAALDRHQKKGDPIGIANVQTGVIRVRGGGENQPHNIRDTVLHEVVHAVLTMGYLDEAADVFKTERMAERVVEVLGTHLLDTLRRNPELVRYLMDDAW
jgi:hypothetical protein